MVERAGIDPHVFVVLGATGDLTQRKLLPALFHVAADEALREKVVLLGVARSDQSDESFRTLVHASLTTAGIADDDLRRSWADERVHYQRVDAEHGVPFAALADRLATLEADHGLSGGRIFYLALPLDAVGPAIESLGAAGLAHGPAWTRLVIEKPFGRDLASAVALNRTIHERFDESQVFRIDHYLGKETVQNLLVFRFANTLFESAWNRDRVASVEITVAEALGVEERAAYYDESGAIRDMVQNHLTQLLALTAMDVPGVLTADAVRNEKVKVLQTIRPVDPTDVVVGQYGPSNDGAEPCKGYRQEDGIDPASTTETFAALCLHLENWRWQGVPFLLRTGKRLPRKSTRIVVRFRRPPVAFFPAPDPEAMRPNTLTITVQPDEGFALDFELKAPGHPLTIRTHRMHFQYSEAFGPLADGYQTLLADLMRGDPTLFVRADEVEASWALYDPLLARRPALAEYPAGSEGPSEAAALARRCGVEWSTG